MRKWIAMMVTLLMALSAVPAMAFSFIPSEPAEDLVIATEPPIEVIPQEPDTDFPEETVDETGTQTIPPVEEEAVLPPAEEAVVSEEIPVQAQSVPQTRYAKVATEKGTLNMRADASAEAKIVERVPKGTIVTVTETLDGWLKIDYKGTVGYVMSSFMEAYDELPYAPITKENEGEAVVRFKETLQRLGYLKAEDVNKYFDRAMENALTKVQLMNGLALDKTMVSPEMQALVDWNMIVKGKTGYLDTATNEETGLSASIYCWDTAGMLYDDDEAVKVEISFAAQASGGLPPYTITVHKSLTGTGAAYGDEVTSPFSQIWRVDTDRLYIYATVVDAAGDTVTACAPFRYAISEIYGN